MTDSHSRSIGRRSFIKGAAAGALGAAGEPIKLSAQEEEHQDVPSDPALRVRALEVAPR